MLKFAVMGNPIAHSKSPEIHQAFARQFNLEISYERILVASGELAKALHDFQKSGGYGVNITLPLKEEAFGLMQELTKEAQQAQAINTATFKNGVLIGANTDGIGLIRDLKNNHGLEIKNKIILILGAGGAARGIIPALLLANPQKIILANRTILRAQKIKQLYLDNTKLEICDLSSIPSLGFDLIINATSSDITLAKDLVFNSLCYDLAYGRSAQSFLNWAKANGAKACLNGLGMLVEQAAEAFYIWHHKRPETKAILTQLLNLKSNHDEINL